MCYEVGDESVCRLRSPRRHFLVPLLWVIASPAANAASSNFCDGGYPVLGKAAGSKFKGTVAAPTGRFLVQGRYTQFEIDPATFAAYNYTFTGAPNPGGLTGGPRSSASRSLRR